MQGFSYHASALGKFFNHINTGSEISYLASYLFLGGSWLAIAIDIVCGACMAVGYQQGHYCMGYSFLAIGIHHETIRSFKNFAGFINTRKFYAKTLGYGY